MLGHPHTLAYLGEIIQNRGQFVVPSRLRVLDLAHVKLANALDGPPCGGKGHASQFSGHAAAFVGRACTTHACPYAKPTIVHDSRSLPLRLRQDNVNKVLARRHDAYGLEVVDGHGARRKLTPLRQTTLCSWPKCSAGGRPWSRLVFLLKPGVSELPCSRAAGRGPRLGAPGWEIGFQSSVCDHAGAGQQHTAPHRMPMERARRCCLVKLWKWKQLQLRSSAG